MYKQKLINNFFEKEIVFLLILYLTLLIGFYFGENSTGGAIIDYSNQKEISKLFAINFKDTFFNYDNFATRHSPILIIFISFLEKYNIPDLLIRLIYLHINLFLPLIFYKCLKLKFKETDYKILILLTSLIFISPTFRSLSIWPDSRLVGLLFFNLGIYYYLKFKFEKKFSYVILNVLSISFSSYLSPNFSVFSIFFFLTFLKNYKIISKEIFFIIILNLILSFPAFFYIFYLDINFLNKSAAINFDNNEKIIFNNISNDILITYSIIFFYILPFIFCKIIKVEKFFNFKILISSILIFTICANFFDYQFKFSGGGIFFKASNIIFENNLFFFMVCFISIYLINLIFRQNLLNFFILFLIFLNNPQYTVYHKYFDPFLLICFFTIFSFNINQKLIAYKQNFIYIFGYYSFFLIISFFKSLWII